jgi:hypothetical protein
VVQLQSVVHLPRACVADSSVSKGKRDKMGSCWGIMLELLPVGGAWCNMFYCRLHLLCAGAVVGV